MSRPFDASLKDLIVDYPADWLALVGVSTSGGVEVIDTDLSTVSAAADRIIRVLDPEPWLLHIELQSSPRSELPEQLLWYNTLVRHRHRERVRTIVVLLRPSADSPGHTGIYQDGFPGEPPYVQFRYQVIRLWEIPAEQLLTGGLGTLPLAPVGKVAEAELPQVVRRLDERLARDVSKEQAELLLATTMIVTGLRLPQEAVTQLYRGVQFMSILEDSSVSQILEQRFRLREAKSILLDQGAIRFGSPGEEVAAKLQALEDLPELRRLTRRLVQVASWEELLHKP